MSASATVNRANAQSSTGPRTAEGKLHSSQNAISHGLTAGTALLPGEDADAYHHFCRRMIEDLRPEGMLEEQLAQTVADAQWRLNRCRNLERKVTLAEYQDPLKLTEALSKFSLYEHRLTRKFQTTLKQFRDIQADRRQREKAEFDDAAKVMKHHQSKQIDYNPAHDGFVFSAPQLDTWMRRQQHIEDAALAELTEGNVNHQTGAHAASA
ncbi:MAG TPA: hypothetical protein VEU96_23990 [Bryobacteraceae bacterium]|nr:hypothetical protein [Bryobacteraceae bacterium]